MLHQPRCCRFTPTGCVSASENLPLHSDRLRFGQRQPAASLRPAAFRPAPTCPLHSEQLRFGEREPAASLRAAPFCPLPVVALTIRPDRGLPRDSALAAKPPTAKTAHNVCHPVLAAGRAVCFSYVQFC